MIQKYSRASALEVVCEMNEEGNAGNREMALRAAQENDDPQFVAFVEDEVPAEEWYVFLNEAFQTCSEKADGVFVHESR